MNVMTFKKLLAYSTQPVRNNLYVRDALALHAHIPAKEQLHTTTQIPGQTSSMIFSTQRAKHRRSF